MRAMDQKATSWPCGLSKPPKGSHRAAKQKRKVELERWRISVNEWVLGADGYACQICGGVACHAHHVYGRGNSPDHEYEQPDARLSVCHTCHIAIHNASPNLQRITQEHVETCLRETVKNRPVFYI